MIQKFVYKVEVIRVCAVKAKTGEEAASTNALPLGVALGCCCRVRIDHLGTS